MQAGNRQPAGVGTEFRLASLPELIDFGAIWIHCRRCRFAATHGDRRDNSRGTDRLRDVEHASMLLRSPQPSALSPPKGHSTNLFARQRYAATPPPSSARLIEM